MTIGSPPQGDAGGAPTRGDPAMGEPAGDVAGGPIRPGLDLRLTGWHQTIDTPGPATWGPSNGVTAPPAPMGHVQHIDRVTATATAPSGGATTIGSTTATLVIALIPPGATSLGDLTTVDAVRCSNGSQRAITMNAGLDLWVPAGWAAGAYLLSATLGGADTWRIALGWRTYQLLPTTDA